MRNSAVLWSEGMFLRPHHFQASDRFWNELIGAHGAFDHPYGYGVFSLSVSSEALSAGTLEISGLKMRWKDGSVLLHEADHVERLDLAKRLEGVNVGTQPITVFAALPTFLDDEPNVGDGTDETTKRRRYLSFRRNSPDENEGTNAQELSYKKLNYRLVLSTEETAGLELLPLLRIVKADAEDAQYRIDSSYFPPSLTTQSWPELSGVVRAVHDLIGGRIQTLGQLIRDKSITLSSQSQGDLEKMMLLHALNEAHGELSCLAFAAGIHPLVGYTCLCRIVGALSLFGPETIAEGIPKYDHDNLEKIYRWALDRIRKLIYAVKEDEYEQRFFIGAGHSMHVSLEPEWFGEDWDWYFGVDPVNISGEDCYQLLKSTSIDWKLGSADKVEQYMTRRQPGITLKRSRVVPSVLPSRGNWLYLQIVRDGDAWKHVHLTHSMAIRIRVDQIANVDTLEGARRIRLNINGQTIGLEFAVFAVRKRV
ncbi:MAG: type VI secretion system baseplate subunit TssK [Pirellulales bacterium]